MRTLTRQRSAAVVADWLKITVLSDPATADTERLMRAITTYHQRHGHLRVPVDWHETLPLDCTRIPLLKKKDEEQEHAVVEGQEPEHAGRRKRAKERQLEPGHGRGEGQGQADGQVEEQGRKPAEQERAVGPEVVVVRLGWELERARRQWRRDRDDLRALIAEHGPDEGLEVWQGRPRRVPGDLAALLGEYGFVWEPRASARQLLVEAAREYAHRYGHFLPAVEETINVDGQEVRIGRLLSECRRPSWGARDEEREVARVLDGLGVRRVRDGAP
ncbi:hypothetical protein [Streptomyces flavofungini]|uniref:hypothetical protein n=1 Tax=Streptomyces flavofungini TaxID=68200 RepID=UPI0025B03C0E|nr:hypothetical protein [Streptomyces flavofungini]WJV44082.1 hypothetical protein QUY26_00075 [Streptomyces flavofungini]WJV51049.1 hypothetical protein QUY26_39485 [Streptomyces flavofungini]